MYYLTTNSNMRQFFIKFEGVGKIYSEEGLKSFIETAVLHDKAISRFTVVEIDSRISKQDTFMISSCYKRVEEFLSAMRNEETPLDFINRVILPLSSAGGVA